MTPSKRFLLRAVPPFAAASAVMLCLASPSAQSPAAPAGGRGANPGQERGSPASVRPPQSRTAQNYPPEQVKAGQGIFAAQCGFCHGRDANGGETGPDLTRSQVVADDVRGDKILAVV